MSEHYAGSCPPGQHCCLCAEDALRTELAAARALLREAVHMNDLAMQDFPVPLPIEEWLKRARAAGGEG